MRECTWPGNNVKMRKINGTVRVQRQLETIDQRKKRGQGNRVKDLQIHRFLMGIMSNVHLFLVFFLFTTVVLLLIVFI